MHYCVPSRFNHAATRREKDDKIIKDKITDHFNGEATEHFLNHLAEQLSGELGHLGESALDRFYLASYEVKGATWTPDFLRKFRGYQGYGMTRFLPVLTGAVVEDRSTTEA